MFVGEMEASSSISQQTDDDAPEIVAHHFTEAGLAREATDHWIEARRLAHARQANREAANFFDLRPLVARCHHGLGKLYLQAGRPDQAGEQLAVATTMYRDMEMRFWLEQADAELSRLPHLAQMSED